MKRKANINSHHHQIGMGKKEENCKWSPRSWDSNSAAPTSLSTHSRTHSHARTHTHTHTHTHTPSVPSPSMAAQRLQIFIFKEINKLIPKLVWKWKVPKIVKAKQILKWTKFKDLCYMFLRHSNQDSVELT